MKKAALITWLEVDLEENKNNLDNSLNDEDIMKYTKVCEALEHVIAILKINYM